VADGWRKAVNLLDYDQLLERTTHPPIVNRVAAESSMKRYLQKLGIDLLPIKWWAGEDNLAYDQLPLAASFESEAWQAVTNMGSANPGANALTVGRNFGLQRVGVTLDEIVRTLLGVHDKTVSVGKMVAEAFAWASARRALGADRNIGQLAPVERYRDLLQAVFDAYCSGLWAFQIGNFAVTCIARPEIRTEDGRLHSANKPAVSFGAIQIFCWRGVRVQQAWIERPTEINPHDALMEKNVELRRTAIEIVGWKRIIEQLDAKVIDHNPDPMIGDLLEANLPFDRWGSRGTTRCRFLRARCGTGRTIVLCVPNDFNRADEANAWTQGITVAQLKKLETRT
jgi:hypothetical protein